MRILEEGNDNPLQHSGQVNPTDRGVWPPTVHVVAEETNTTWRLNNYRIGPSFIGSRSIMVLRYFMF